jgi:hypothetical protein
MAAPSDLLLGVHWNNAAPALDTNILVINDGQQIDAAINKFYWSYFQPAGYFAEGTDQSTNPWETASGTKWGFAKCIDLTAGTVNGDRYVTRDFAHSVFGGPTNQRIRSFAVWIKPAYSGTPGTTIAFGGPGGQSWSGGTYNSGMLYHSATDGKLKFIHFGSSHGTPIGTTASSSAWSPTSGQWYLLEVSFDYSGGQQFVFIDGTVVGQSTHTGTMTGTSADYWIVGAPNVSTFMGAEGPVITNHYQQELVLYDGLWHTTSYTVDDRPWLEKIQETGMPFVLDYVRDLAVGAEYMKTPLPRDRTMETTVGIDTIGPKFGGGCLTSIDPPNFPRLGWWGAGLVSTLGNAGTISYWFKQLGTPPFTDDQVHFHIRDGDFWRYNGANSNTVKAFQYTSGNLRVEINHSGSVAAVVLDAVTPFTLGDWHHVEIGFNIDGVDREGWLFIDGVQVDSQATSGSPSRAAGATRLLIGDDEYGNQDYSNFSMDEFLVFEVVQHTSGFTPPTSEINFENSYETDLIAYATSGDLMSGRLTQNIATGLREGQ